MVAGFRDCCVLSLMGKRGSPTVSNPRIVDAIRMENVIGGPHRASKPEDVLLYTYTGGTTKHSKCVVVTSHDEN